MIQTPLAALTLSLGACANDPATVAVGETMVVEPEGGPYENENGRSVAPPAVAGAFAAAHPTATDVTWAMEGADYEGEARIDGVETSVLYPAAGVAGAVKTKVAAALARDHAGHPVTEAARIVDAGRTTYVAEVTVDGVVTDLIFQEDGTLTETTAAESD